MTAPLQLRIWPESHMQILGHLQKGQSTKPPWGGSHCMDFPDPSGPGLVLPGDGGLSAHSPPTVSPHAYKKEVHSE